MKPLKDLIKTREYWLGKIQNELYALLDDYMEEKGINQSQLAEELGFSKGYLSRVLNGNFNHSLEKLIELTLAVGKVPNIHFQKPEEYLEEERNNYYEYVNHKPVIQLSLNACKDYLQSSDIESANVPWNEAG
jgi:transcriptional regulator with XRE-family HTH domain